MSYKTSEVASNDAVPDTLICFLKTALHVVGNELLAGCDIECVLGILNCELYHVIFHIVELDHWLSETHVDVG